MKDPYSPPKAKSTLTRQNNRPQSDAAGLAGGVTKRETFDSEEHGPEYDYSGSQPGFSVERKKPNSSDAEGV